MRGLGTAQIRDAGHGWKKGQPLCSENGYMMPDMSGLGLVTFPISPKSPGKKRTGPLAPWKEPLDLEIGDTIIWRGMILISPG